MYKSQPFSSPDQLYPCQFYSIQRVMYLMTNMYPPHKQNKALRTAKTLSVWGIGGHLPPLIFAS